MLEGETPHLWPWRQLLLLTMHFLPGLKPEVVGNETRIPSTHQKPEHRQVQHSGDIRRDRHPPTGCAAGPRDHMLYYIFSKSRDTRHTPQDLTFPPRKAPALPARVQQTSKVIDANLIR